MIKQIGDESLAHKKVSCFNLHFSVHICGEHHGDHHVRPWGQSGAGGGIDSLTSELPPKPPTSHKKQLASTSTKSHLNSPFNVCVLLSSVWVDSHVQLLQLRAGAVPLIVWRQSELLGASSSAWTQSAAHSEWGRASSLHRGPLNSSAPASRRRATATGGQQLLFHNQSAAKKLFSFARFLLLLAPGWHTYCDINLELVLLCSFRSFADTLKVLANNVHTQNVVRHVLVWFLAELCHF